MGFKRPVNIILNQVRKPALAQVAFTRFRDLARKKLSLKANLWGSLSYESLAMQTRVMESPLSESVPQSRVIREIQTVGDRLLAEQPPENQTLSLESFWNKFLETLAKIPQPAPEPPKKEPAPDLKAEEAIPEATELPDNALCEPSQSAQGKGDPVQKPIINEALLVRLCKHVEAISQELAALRVDVGNHLNRPIAVEPEPPPKKELPETFVLDFEDYLKKYG